MFEVVVGGIWRRGSGPDRKQRCYIVASREREKFRFGWPYGGAARSLLSLLQHDDSGTAVPAHGPGVYLGAIGTRSVQTVDVADLAGSSGSVVSWRGLPKLDDSEEDDIEERMIKYIVH